MQKTKPKVLLDLLHLIDNKIDANHQEKNKWLILLSEIMSCSVPELFTKQQYLLNDEQLSRFFALSKKMEQGIPLQYVLGRVNFYGYWFIVDESVLIPRPETEGLVVWILSCCKGKYKVLDLGSGSGAIGIALKKSNVSLNVSLSDISIPALRITRKNALYNECNVNLIQSDMFSRIKGKFDVIVSNPPYVSNSEYRGLPKEIRCYEPRLALDGGPDGLLFYRKIISQADRYINPGGYLFLEIGSTQADKIKFLANNYAWKDIEVRQDLNGFDRYVKINK